MAATKRSKLNIAFWIFYWAVIGPLVSLIPARIFWRVAAEDLRLREIDASARGLGLPQSDYDLPAISGFAFPAFFLTLCAAYYVGIYFFRKQRGAPPGSLSRWIFNFYGAALLGPALVILWVALGFCLLAGFAGLSSVLP